MEKAKLSDIIDGIESQSDETHSYFDRQKGCVVMVTDEDEVGAEDEELEEDAPDWQKEAIALAREIDGDASGRFVALPSEFDVDEWRMMERFSMGLEDQAASEELLRAIQGRGAFRYFKDRAADLGLLKEWFAFRDESYRDLAIGWCQAHDIEFEVDFPSSLPAETAPRPEARPVRGTGRKRPK